MFGMVAFSHAFRGSFGTDIMNVLQNGFGGDAKYRPCPLLQEMVAARRLGKQNPAGVFMCMSDEASSQFAHL